MCYTVYEVDIFIYYKNFGSELIALFDLMLKEILYCTLSCSTKKFNISSKHFWASDSFIMLEHLYQKINLQSLTLRNAVTAALKIKSIRAKKKIMSKPLN